MAVAAAGLGRLKESEKGQALAGSGGPMEMADVVSWNGIGNGMRKGWQALELFC